MRVSEQPLISSAQIAQRTAQLAAQLEADRPGESIALVAVLKGAVPFAVDLMKRMNGRPTLDFIRARSYTGTASSGHVDVSMVPEPGLSGRHVVLIEDIVDTGRTAAALLECLATQQPASLRLCALLDKPSRRVVPVSPEYVGFTIEDRFVVGYGLDYEEHYRHLPAVYVIEEEPVQ